METVSIVARQPLEYAGRRLKTRQRFDARPDDAALLITLKLADPVKPAPIEEATIEPIEPVKRRRRDPVEP